MEATEPQPDVDFSSMPARARRAIALICVSIVAIAGAAAAYIHPSLPSARSAPVPQGSSYHVSTVDFVNPTTGWVVVDFDSGDYTILHTDDGGFSWTRQLAGAGGGHPHYVKFFDVAVGVFGMLGTTPRLFRTGDGGRTWDSLNVPRVEGAALSWSFVDSDFGWLLVSGTTAQTPLPAYLYRTEDGGFTWQDLGVPAPAPDQVFQASFSYFTTGWLTSANGGPYAYKTTDFGQTWTRVPLPAPAGGWPEGGTFMVAVQPTSGGGAAASVVFVPTLYGRKGAGATIRDFPPLTVRAFDGGRPVSYTYATAVGDRNLGPIPQVQAPNQVELGTLDNGATWTALSLPSSPGALGYFDAANWWWIGSGQWATSGDGGATWSDPRGLGVIGPVPGTLQLIDRNHAWFAAASESSPLLETTNDGGVVWRMVLLPPVPDLPTTP